MRRPLTFTNVTLFFPRLIFAICYGVGWTALAGVRMIEVAVRSSWRRVWRKLHHKGQGLRRFRPAFTLVTFGILLLGITAALQGAHLIARGQLLKGQVLGAADEGLAHLGEARDSLQSQDANGASRKLALALQSFEKSRSDLNSNDALLQGILDLVPQKHSADHLLQATVLLTQAGQDWAQFYQLSQTVKVNPQGVTGSTQSGQILKEMNDRLQAGRVKTDQAIQLLTQVDPQIIPADKQQIFRLALENLTLVQTAVDSVSDVFNILYSMAAGNKNVLLLFQNNNELRATGGFLGTYGAMKLKDGAINQLQISSIYDLDGQLTENFAPPGPLLSVSPRWFLRDSNWFTDFPQSARVITRFYEKEGGETPDLIIAITPQLIVDWLRITGPVTLPRYGTTLSADNFIEQTQIQSSIEYDKSLNQPKQILADFYPAFLQQLGQLSGPQLLPIITALQNNLLSKHVLLYSRNAVLQRELEKFNWTGSVKSTDRDFLLVSTSNQGGTKTDLHISQTISLNSSLGRDGRLMNTLTIERTNPLPPEESMKNLSFMRIYVPTGSRLVSAQGFAPLDIPPVVDFKQKSDPDVQAWEQHVITDLHSGTIIGQESGKTIFGNWLEVGGGQTKTVTLHYELPFSIHNVDHHSLVLQKQAGSVNQTFHYNLLFPDYLLAWKNFEPQKGGSQSFTMSGRLDQDEFFGLILNRQ